MEKTNKVLVVLFALILAYGCREERHNEYTGLEYRGGKNIHIASFASVDTIYIDAGATSLDGQWLLSNGRLLFVDAYMVGVRVYDIKGNFISRHINRGRGPNEMIGEAYVSEATDNGGLVMINSSWQMYFYDSLYRRQADPYGFLSDIRLAGGDWKDLLMNPDPQVKYMYEFFPLVQRIKVTDSIMVMPIITEHIRYNGYETGDNAGRYWKEVYNMIFIDLKNRVTGDLFGSYPPVYRQNNIPVFSQFDFDVDKEKGNLYVGFAADSLIYVRDLKSGRLLYDFGCSANGVSDNYPSTGSFEQYESRYKEDRKKYGYYTQLIKVGNYLFREYKKEGDAGFGLQIYDDNVLIGNVDTYEPIRIIGEYDGWLYCSLPADLDNECFRILKFTL